jgi:hypothetical protein
VGGVMSDITFSSEEISIIDKNLGFLVFDWAKNLINHILTVARDKGVKVVYMNIPESLAVNAPVSNEDKAEYFYEKLPPLLGFSQESVNLRGRKETLWAYRFSEENVNASIVQHFMKTTQVAQVSFEQIPPKYQGAFLGIIGRKQSYTREEVNKVLAILKSKSKGKDKGKAGGRFYYDWESTKWTGGQRFSPKVTETVVLQKLDDQMVAEYYNNPVLAKFFSFMMRPNKHFGSDEMGFALVSRVSPQIWVINEIQTDCINHYMSVRGQLYKDREEGKKGVNWETLRDMLEGQNRSKWIPKMEANEAFKNQVMANPNIIQQLPDNTQDIDKWIKEQTGMGEGILQRQNEIRQYLAQTDFRGRIFRTY